VFEYLWSLWQAIQLGLNLDPETVQLAATIPNASWIALGVVMTAGISILLGQSVILFANQVSPRRFVLSLISNGVLVVVGWIFWSVIVWLIGNWLFTQEPEFTLVLRLIGLSYAPLVFGFLVLMPYLGPFVNRVLYAWSFVIALRSIMFTFSVTFWQALLCVGIGWLMLMLLTATVGRPLVAIRNWFWYRVTRVSSSVSPKEFLEQLAISKSTPAGPVEKPTGDQL
jgi:hypothetical protein